ncbi:hypothetical protein [Paenibacillus filicis]
MRNTDSSGRMLLQAVFHHFTSGSLSWIGGAIVGAALLPMAFTFRLQQRTASVVNEPQQKAVSSD